jgi:hypothetical protein
MPVSLLHAALCATIAPRATVATETRMHLGRLYGPQKGLAGKHTLSATPWTWTQQFVEQSEFCVQDLWHASAPVPSNVEHENPLQHWLVPPQVSS